MKKIFVIKFEKKKILIKKKIKLYLQNKEIIFL